MRLAFFSAFNRRGKDEYHPLGFLHANMGSSGAEIPSALAAPHGGLCGSFHCRAASRQPGLPHHWQ